MNHSNPIQAPLKLLYRIGMDFRRLLPRRKSYAFESSNSSDHSKIGCIYVINLDRQPTRWADMKQELRYILDWSGSELINLTERYDAVDAKNFTQDPLKDTDIDPTYTLEEQLFVEPQPLTLPTQLDLNSPIRMSRPEVAVARSHIEIWCRVAASSHGYVLVLEDDVWFRYGFAKNMDQVWREIEAENDRKSMFDILYLSYEEVKNGAPKNFLSSNVFCPERGLWHLSGYVISRIGAEKLLRLLPCRGPVDLWINHQFVALDVKAAKRSIISQRRDLCSTNSYSILPTLTKIGAITSEVASLPHIRPGERPVFAFGAEGSGLSSLAMALSMLGYRCCSDLQALPYPEQDRLLSGSSNRVFDAYVNIKSLMEKIWILRECYPEAKYIITTNKTKNLDGSNTKLLDNLNGADLAVLQMDASNKWKVICEHLRCVPPSCSFPEIKELGQRQILNKSIEVDATLNCKTPKWDKSPWVVESSMCWRGIDFTPIKGGTSSITTTPIRLKESLNIIDTRRWLLRDDTFTDNLALFRPSNIEFCNELGLALNIKRESLGIREYSAAALTSHDRYLFGRFEAIIKASNVPGVVTGFFLHRDSPRQEIDIEIAGNRTDRLLVNVFYNPGDEGAKFDYGYRGAASYIDLGFDASESEHRFVIEWSPFEICWFVDDRLVHKRAEWNPTPIPHLPMALHVNAWPSRSKELAGRLIDRRLPSSTFIRSIELEANRQRRSNHHEYSFI